MARARNIKPGLYKNEDLADCSVWARYIFPGLWMMADREGRMEDRPKRLKSELLPYDQADMDALLSELQSHGFIIRYTAEGVDYIQIVKFSQHQTPHVREQASTIPAPDKASLGSAMSSPRSPDSLIPSSLIPDTKEKTAPPKTGDGACTFPTFLLRCKEQGTAPVPPEDPIFAYATDAGIPDDWLRMCWSCFRERYAEAAKKYAGVKGWRSAFRNSVRQSWFELWWHDGTEYKLTSKGQQAMAVLKSRDSKQPEAE